MDEIGHDFRRDAARAIERVHEQEVAGEHAHAVAPEHARRFGVEDPERALHDASTNVGASAALLKTLRLRYGDDLPLVLAAYNAGEGAVRKYGNKVPPYPETQAYVRDVIDVYRRLVDSFEVTPAARLLARTQP